MFSPKWSISCETASSDRIVDYRVPYEHWRACSSLVGWAGVDVSGTKERRNG